MVEIREQTDIRATADEIFSVIVDLRGYDRWLTASKAFSGITRAARGAFRGDPNGIIEGGSVPGRGRLRASSARTASGFRRFPTVIRGSSSHRPAS